MDYFSSLLSSGTDPGQHGAREVSLGCPGGGTNCGSGRRFRMVGSGSRSPRRTPTPLTTLQFHARSAPGSRRSASSPELQLYVTGCATEPGAATTATLLRPVPPTTSPPWLEKNHHEALESFSEVSQARQHTVKRAATLWARAERPRTWMLRRGWRRHACRSHRLWPSRRCGSGRAPCSTTGCGGYGSGCVCCSSPPACSSDGARRWCGEPPEPWPAPPC